MASCDFHGQLQYLSDPTSFARYLAPLRKTKWVVYAKPPFGGPEKALDYLGRYTHRVAISNHRLRQLQYGRVTFAYKDYKDQQPQKLMTLCVWPSAVGSGRSYSHDHD